MKLLSDFKKQFDQEINNYLDEKIKLAKKIDEKAVDLYLIIKDFINNGGKRLRPAIFYYSLSSYYSQNLGKVLNLSLIFELFHSFALIHDDIIDNSDLRRGNMTVHKKYDLPTAILAGDLALMLADEIFTQEVKEQNTINLYNEFKQELLIGEYLDTIKINNVNKIMELKTSRYSFVKPATIAFGLAQIDKNENKKWEKILREMGILFQIKDDYDGVFGDEKKIGKSTDSDIYDGKNTLIIQRFLKKANDEDKKHFNSFFGKPNTNKKDIVWFKNSLKTYGVDHEFKDKILNDSKALEVELTKNFPDNYLNKLMKEILLHFQSTL